MLKRVVFKKSILTVAVMFSLALMYIIPTNNSDLNITEEILYKDSDVIKSVIYLLDDSNYLGRTKVAVQSNDIVNKSRELLEILIKGGKGESKIPSGFQSIIPSDTKVLSVELENEVLKINFSKELLELKKEYEEKMIEAIIYTLTNINGVNKIIIYVEGDILSKLPKTGINLPSTLDRNYGINKEYNLESYKNVNQVNVYYVSKTNDDTYYVPVTKYLNDDRDKIKVIIDELAGSPLYRTNLMSYLNSNINLLDAYEEENIMHLIFDEYIFNDLNEKNILEEVIYTISLSISDNYDIEQVIFEVNNEEIYKSVLKTIE